MMITVLVIPVESLQRAYLIEISGHIDSMQEIVGGLIERVDLFHPHGTLYLNEEGKLRGLPYNRRATVILWAHNRRFIRRDIVVGDAFITGPADEDGRDTDVHPFYRQFEGH